MRDRSRTQHFQSAGCKVSTKYSPGAERRSGCRAARFVSTAADDANVLAAWHAVQQRLHQHPALLPLAIKSPNRAICAQPSHIQQFPLWRLLWSGVAREIRAACSACAPPAERIPYILCRQIPQPVPGGGGATGLARVPRAARQLALLQLYTAGKRGQCQLHG